MKPLMSFFTTLFLFLFSLASTQAQWVTVPSNTSEALYHLFFATPDTGFVVGESDALYKTTDGGGSWDTIHLNTPNPLSAIHFPSKNVGYINGFKTTDMGATWHAIAAPSSDGVNSFYFINDSVGFFSYANGIIGKTTNAGLTWVYQDWMGTQVYEEIEFPSDSVGYLVGWYSGSISKTTDQGTTWHLIDGMQAISIDFPSQDTGYVVGWYGVIQRTTNAGSTWELQNAGLTQDRVLYDVFCTDNNTCYAVGDSGVILKTIDGGQNWAHQYSGTTEDLNSLFFTDANTGFIVGTNGTILKTSNGGELTGIPSILPYIEVSVFPNPASDFVTVTLPEGRAYKSLTLYNFLGREVQRVELADGQTEVSIATASLLRGVYFLAPQGRMAEARKFMVSR